MFQNVSFKIESDEADRIEFGRFFPHQGTEKENNRHRDCVRFCDGTTSMRMGCRRLEESKGMRVKS